MKLCRASKGKHVNNTVMFGDELLSVVGELISRSGNIQFIFSFSGKLKNQQIIGSYQVVLCVCDLSLINRTSLCHQCVFGRDARGL